MFVIGTVKIRSYEKGLYFYDGEFRGFLGTGRHWFFDPFNRIRVDVVNQRAPWLDHPDLDLVVKSDALKGQTLVLDLKDNERALVWVDGRFDAILSGGLYALWTTYREVRVETVDARGFRFEHENLNVILDSPGSEAWIEEVRILDEQLGVVFRDGRYVETIGPGRYAFWKGVDRAKVYRVSKRGETLDVSGQEIMTADKVTLRLNAVVFYRVVDALKAVSSVADVGQSLYREVQLALRAVVGTRNLDDLLAEKDALASELEVIVAERAKAFGVATDSIGVKDVILPGDMKELLNKVTEAKKAAEANLIARREETAAMRSQANTAKLLENNPVLMRLRELEVLEKVAGTSKLNVVLGEKGLADRVVNLL